MKKPVDFSAACMLALIFAIPMAFLAWVVWVAHKDTPRLRQECEERGGMLISTRGDLHTCVGKPTKPADPA